VRLRWVFGVAIFATTTAAAALSAHDGDPVAPLHGFGSDAAYVLGALAGLVLPAAFGFVWRRSLVFFAVSIAYFLGLLAADALTYDTLRDHCNSPQVDACDPGPFPATFLLILLPFVLAATLAGLAAGGASNQIRKRSREQPHLGVRADGHADRARGAEGS
jgi:hypothetical protein